MWLELLSVGGAANRLLHADRGRFQGAILGLMWLELLSVLNHLAAAIITLRKISLPVNIIYG
jgi:hypothetical protein